MEKENIERTNNISGAKNNTSETLNDSENVTVNIITTTKFDFLKKKLFIILLLLILVLLAGVSTFFLLTKLPTDKTNILNVPTSTPKQYPSITPGRETGLETKVREKDVLLKLGVGYQIAIDKSWDVKIVESGKQHNFLTASVSNSGVRIEVEAFSHTLPNWEEYLKNELYQIEKTETKKINNDNVKVETGKEAFAQSKARLIIGTWDNQDKTLVVRVIGNNQNSINSLFEQLSSSVNLAQKTTFRFIKEVLAAENTVPSKLPSMEFKEIEVMGELLEDTITSKDTPYKDGYARGYRFVAFKSQKLASYAEEDASLGKSYIHSQLFDSNGNAISSEMDTHIEFKATYTGEYFLIVWTFNKQGGKVTVRIDDNDQLGCSSIIKYPDGAELAMNPEERAAGGDVIVGYFDVGYIYQCPKPITVLNDNLVQVETVPRKPGEAPKLMSWQVNVWISADMYKPKEGKNTTFIPAEDKDSNKVAFKIQQIGANRILITPENGLFLKGQQVAIRGWGSRFFTQTKMTPPDLPILKEILEKFADDFQPKQTYDFAAIEPMYFDWRNEDNVETEVYGGWLWYRKPVTSDDEGRSLLDKYKQYFIDKGYAVSEQNNYQGPSSKDPTRQKWTVGLLMNQTACKVIYDSNAFSIYCGNLQ